MRSMKHNSAGCQLHISSHSKLAQQLTSVRRHRRPPTLTPSQRQPAGPLAATAATATADAPASVSTAREDSLLLAYYACQNQSLFAAQCFVEGVLDAYTCGYNVDQLQTALQLRNMQQGGALLQPQDENLLLSWIILVMLAAQEVGIPLAAPAEAADAPESGGQQQQRAAGEAETTSGPAAAAGAAPPAASGAAAGGGISSAFSREVMGLLQFAKQAAKLWFDEGYNVQKLQSLQATVASDPAQGQSQVLVMMQQYTRLVIIALEVAAGCKLRTVRPLDNDLSLGACPSGYTAAFGPQALAPYTTLQQQQQEGGDTQDSSSSSRSRSCGSDGEPVGLVTAAAIAAGRGGVRAHAVRLMTAFVGAVIGSSYSKQAFVLAALEAYEAGIPAEVLHKQLAEAEFAQTGGLVPALPQPEVLVDINRTLFGRWLSLVYMSAAQMNAVFPAAGQHSGWAWYGGEDEVQANAMAGFVAQTLLRLQEEAAAAAAAADEQQGDLDVARLSEDPLVQRVK